jgi:hypothetical protein
MIQPLDYDGDLVITDDNAHLATILRSVSGCLIVKTPNLTFPMLTRVGRDLFIGHAAENTSLPALEWVGGHLDIFQVRASLPVLAHVGRDLWIGASGVSLPVLTKVAGGLLISYRALNTLLPALTRVGVDLDIGSEAENTSLPVLEEVGGRVKNHGQAHLPALRTAA